MGVIVKIMINFFLVYDRPEQTAAFQRVGLVTGSKMGGC